MIGDECRYQVLLAFLDKKLEDGDNRIFTNRLANTCEPLSRASSGPVFLSRNQPRMHSTRYLANAVSYGVREFRLVE